MLREIIGNIMVCFTFIFIIFSIIKLVLRNKKLEEENEALKECIKSCLDTFKDIHEGQEKVFKAVRETKEDLLAKKLEG